MSILNTLRREWRAYSSPRFWILGILLVVLGALAALQFRWIDQVAQSERERAKRNLSKAVSDFERDFDVEITRVVAAFEFPALNASEYAERYQEWRHLSPYPDVIHGVYVLDTRKPSLALQEVVPGEPPINSTDWEQDLQKLALPLHANAASPPPPASSTGLHVVAQAGLVRAWGLSRPNVLVGGNPAFIFPIVPAAHDAVTQTITHIRGNPVPLMGSFSVIGAEPPSQWTVIVLDANYLQSRLLPSLVKTYFPVGSSTDYDVLVIDKMRSASQRILYQSPSAVPEEKFVHTDGAASLFLLRMDCFGPALQATGAAVANTRVLQRSSKLTAPITYSTSTEVVGVPAEAHQLSGEDRLSDILRRRPESCSDAGMSGSADSVMPWELLVRYRAGSLDQAMSTFRRRNLLLSICVLSILTVGICMLVVLTERARSLAQMQSEFVLGVSHELRTPLTVIRVAADNLRKGMADDAEQVHRYGDIITRHASELSDMIEETLVFARVQSGSLIGKRTPVSAEKIVRTALASCGSVLRDAGITVEVQLAAQLPLIEAEVRLLERCLQNLIQNVAKYAAAGKWMGIRIRRVILPEGERVQITVDDHGSGISPLDLPHIFEPFYRGKSGQPLAVPGIGLGLTFVKRVVEAHLGKVEVHSSDQGSSFSIVLRPSPERNNREEE